jgi:hypothetical protein
MVHTVRYQQNVDSVYKNNIAVMVHTVRYQQNVDSVYKNNIAVMLRTVVINKTWTVYKNNRRHAKYCRYQENVDSVYKNNIAVMLRTVVINKTWTVYKNNIAVMVHTVVINKTWIVYTKTTSPSCYILSLSTKRGQCIPGEHILKKCQKLLSRNVRYCESDNVIRAISRVRARV